MKSICFVTATRAEYGLLKWILHEVDTSNVFEYQLIVTGTHISEEYGHTIDLIIEDGYRISEIVNVTPDSSSGEMIAVTMANIADQFAHTLNKLRPDYVAVLGDRYELLPIVSTAFVMNIPVIHFSGGDVTEGAIDDGIRNAITMLSQYHFPGTQDSAANIIRMRGSEKNIWAVGEPGLDSINRESLLTREELACDLEVDSEMDWCLFTYHPETRKSLEYNMIAVQNCLECLLKVDNLQIIATYSNADMGGSQINELIESKSKETLGKMIAIPSLGNKRYLSVMAQIRFMLGNSSSGIVEAPMLGVPVVNVGDRQKGRHLCSNIIQSDSSTMGIEEAIRMALGRKSFERDYFWGDGHTSERVIRIMERELA